MNLHRLGLKYLSVWQDLKGEGWGVLKYRGYALASDKVWIIRAPIFEVRLAIAKSIRILRRLERW